MQFNRHLPLSRNILFYVIPFCRRYLLSYVFSNLFSQPRHLGSVLFYGSFQLLSLTFIFRNFITKYWRSAWIILVLMFFLAAIDNLTLQASRIERYGMLLLSLMGVIFGVVFLISRRRRELKEKGVRIFHQFLHFDGTYIHSSQPLWQV